MVLLSTKCFEMLSLQDIKTVIYMKFTGSFLKNKILCSMFKLQLDSRFIYSINFSADIIIKSILDVQIIISYMSSYVYSSLPIT